MASGVSFDLKQLGKCREQIAQRRELEGKSSVEELLKKQRGVGYILKETQP